MKKLNKQIKRKSFLYQVSGIIGLFLIGFSLSSVYRAYDSGTGLFASFIQPNSVNLIAQEDRDTRTTTTVPRYVAPTPTPNRSIERIRERDELRPDPVVAPAPVVTQPAYTGPAACRSACQNPVSSACTGCLRDNSSPPVVQPVVVPPTVVVNQPQQPSTLSQNGCIGVGVWINNRCYLPGESVGTGYKVCSGKAPGSRYPFPYNDSTCPEDSLPLAPAAAQQAANPPAAPPQPPSAYSNVQSAFDCTQLGGTWNGVNSTCTPPSITTALTCSYAKKCNDKNLQTCNVVDGRLTFRSSYCEYGCDSASLSCKSAPAEITQKDDVVANNPLPAPPRSCNPSTAKMGCQQNPCKMGDRLYRKTAASCSVSDVCVFDPSCSQPAPATVPQTPPTAQTGQRCTIGALNSCPLGESCSASPYGNFCSKTPTTVPVANSSAKEGDKVCGSNNFIQKYVSGRWVNMQYCATGCNSSNKTCNPPAALSSCPVDSIIACGKSNQQCKIQNNSPTCYSDIVIASNLPPQTVDNDLDDISIPTGLDLINTSNNGLLGQAAEDVAKAIAKCQSSGLGTGDHLYACICSTMSCAPGTVGDRIATYLKDNSLDSLGLQCVEFATIIASSVLSSSPICERDNAANIDRSCMDKTESDGWYFCEPPDELYADDIVIFPSEGPGDPGHIGICADGSGSSTCNLADVNYQVDNVARVHPISTNNIKGVWRRNADKAKGCWASQTTRLSI